ncbi:hypothetical protein ACQPZ2_15000 [Nocardia pseudovaccinii]|uniref:hypothetical protein n=1 Tax=Nocardia pseudovaccinii TaxID=189540 RepID=UPI003D8A266C
MARYDTSTVFERQPDWQPISLRRSRPRCDDCRIRVRFRGHPTLQYRAAREAAECFAAAVRGLGVDVDIDTELYEGLLPLPCARLWTS